MYVGRDNRLHTVDTYRKYRVLIRIKYIKMAKPSVYSVVYREYTCINTAAITDKISKKEVRKMTL